MSSAMTPTKSNATPAIMINRRKFMTSGMPSCRPLKQDRWNLEIGPDWAARR
jgi:hypothetical protein